MASHLFKKIYILQLFDSVLTEILSSKFNIGIVFFFSSKLRGSDQNQSKFQTLDPCENDFFLKNEEAQEDMRHMF